MRKILNKFKQRLNKIAHKVFKLDISIYPNKELSQRIALFKYHGIDVIIDVGANIGQYGDHLREIGYKGDIISFEPLKVAFEKLKKNAKNDTNRTLINLGLGSESSTQRIHVSKNLVSSSINEVLSHTIQNDPSAEFVGIEEINIQSLDSLYESLNLAGKNVFMKIDTQGYEKQVLDGAAESLKKIKGLQIEMAFVPSYYNAPTFDQIKQRIEALGFELMAIENGFYDKTSGRQLEVDGIFFKP